MAQQAGDPALALGGALQVADGGPDVGRHRLPEELRIVGPQILGIGEAERGVDPGLLELVEQRRQLAVAAGIGQLADEVGGAYQAREVGGLPVVVAVGDREPRALDVGGEDLGVDDRVAGEALADVELPAVDVVGGQMGVGRAARRPDRLLAEARRPHAVAVQTADAPDVADVVKQQREHEVQPVPRLQRLAPEPPPLEDLQAGIGDHRGVIGVVIERVAAADLGQRRPALGLEQAGVLRRPPRLLLPPGRQDPLDQGVGQQRGRIKHRHTPRCLQPDACAPRLEVSSPCPPGPTGP